MRQLPRCSPWAVICPNLFTVINCYAMFQCSCNNCKALNCRFPGHCLWGFLLPTSQTTTAGTAGTISKTLPCTYTKETTRLVSQKPFHILDHLLTLCTKMPGNSTDIRSVDGSHRCERRCRGTSAHKDFELIDAVESVFTTGTTSCRGTCS